MRSQWVARLLYCRLIAVLSRLLLEYAAVGYQVCPGRNAPPNSNLAQRLLPRVVAVLLNGARSALAFLINMLLNRGRGFVILPSKRETRLTFIAESPWRLRAFFNRATRIAAGKPARRTSRA